MIESLRRTADSTPLRSSRPRPDRERLIVLNADDFGLSSGVNHGIIEAHEYGSLSSTSMLVNMPASNEAAMLARKRAPDLGVGLHLNLVEGKPLTNVPTLTDKRSGNFHSLADLTRRAVGGAISAEDVRRECDAQLVALAQTGIRATHLDSHRHAHALPDILPAVLASARAAGVPVVRRPLDRPPLGAPRTAAKILALHASWRVAIFGAPQEDRAYAAAAPHFRGITIQGKEAFQERLLRVIDHIPAGVTEVMLHPGYDDSALVASDPNHAARERELAALLSAAVARRLERCCVRLVSFTDLHRSR